MIWNFTNDCPDGAVYGCIDALKYISKYGIRSESLTDVLLRYIDDVGINNEDGTVLSGLIAGMTSFGFLTVQTNKDHPLPPSMMITTEGKRLIQSDTTFEIQNCYLEAIKNIQYQADNGELFYPLQWTIDICMELKRMGEAPALGRQEFAYFVQTSSPNQGLRKTIENILSFRSGSNTAERDNKELLFDFADLNFRCLRATRLFQKSGRGIMLMQSNLSTLNA